jgi:flagellar FliJ protein
MRRFRFALQTLLEVRTREEDAVKLELGEKNRLVGRAREELAALHDRLTGLQSSELTTRENAHDVVALRHAVAYRHRLKTEMLRTGQRMQHLQHEAEQVRQRLVAATQRRRAIELIRDRRYREWRREYNAQEQKSIDDLSQQKYIRDKRAEAARRSAPA